MVRKQSFPVKRALFLTLIRNCSKVKDPLLISSEWWGKLVFFEKAKRGFKEIWGSNLRLIFPAVVDQFSQIF